MREARASTAKHFEEEYKRLTAANQKLEQQMKIKSEEKSDGIMSMVSQAIKRGANASPSSQDAKGENSADDELSETMKQVCDLVFIYLLLFALFLEVNGIVIGTLDKINKYMILSFSFLCML